MKRRLYSVFAVPSAMFLTLTSPLVAQTRGPAFGEGVRWSVSEQIPPLTVRGILFDVEAGQPLRAANVSLASTRALVDISPVDSAGRFELHAREVGRHTVFVTYRSGFYPDETVALDLPLDRGAAVFIGVHSVPYCNDLYANDPRRPNGPHVRIVIRDVVSGRAPRVPISVRGGIEGLPDSVVTQPVDADSLTVFLPITGNWSQALAVEVSSPSHVTWNASNVWLSHECPRLWSPSLRAWLLPSEQQ